MRKNKKEDFFDVLNSLPWWVSIALAAFFYIFFKFLLPSINFHNPIHRSFITTFQSFAGLIGCIFLLGALLSIISSLKKKKILDHIEKLDSLRELSWQDFELLVGEYYRRKGFYVTENGGGGADGGIDLILSKNNQKIIIQCKHWKSGQVGVKPIRELYGVMMAVKATNCIFVCSGNYTSDAISFAIDKPIELIDGISLYALISEVRDIKTSSNTTAQTLQTTTNINCPLCGSEMIKRTANRGKNKGKHFYGCIRYPSCKGTINI